MDKAELRKLFMSKRAALSDEERELLSTKITQKLIQSVELKDKKVSIFLPIKRLLEINTKLIIDQVDATFILPVLTEGKLKHVQYESEQQLKVSSWGIPEPQYGVEVDAADINVVLVPLLVVDLKGNRVGYGKGFYDGFLDACSSTCRFVGLSFFDPVTEITDVRPEDISLHHCVTPEQFYTF